MARHQKCLTADPVGLYSPTCPAHLAYPYSKHVLVDQLLLSSWDHPVDSAKSCGSQRQGMEISPGRCSTGCWERLTEASH